MSHRIIAAVVVAVLGAAVLASGSLAAHPKKGGIYEGTLYASGTAAITKKVRLVVDSTGKGAKVIWTCGSGRAPSTLKIPIAADGTFKGSSNVGTVTVWGIVGRFLSANKARAAMRFKTTCDGKGGTVTLTRRS